MSVAKKKPGQTVWTEIKVAVEIKEIKWIFKKKKTHTHTQETAANLSTELPVIVNA